MKTQSIHRSLARTACVVATAVAASFTTAQADQGTVAEPVSMQATAGSSSQALNYWTMEEIATTPAMGLQIDYGSPEAAEAEAAAHATVEGAEQETAGSVRGSTARRGSSRYHRSHYPQDWGTRGDIDYGKFYQNDGASVDSGAADLMAGTSGIFTDYPVNRKTALWKLYPHVFVGKLTFTTSSGNKSCSATAIRNNHIVTAAHCVYGTSGDNVWYTNKVFTPAYRNGNAPYGSFPTAGCTVLGEWAALSGAYIISTWARHDVAVCKMGKNSAGWTLNQAIGAAGYSYNFGYEQLHFVSGYPARDTDDRLLTGPAQYLRSCTSESFRLTTDTLGTGCKYGRGISGGSWMKDYNANYISARVNSVNSGIYFNQPNTYGARFTSNNIKKLCDGSGC